VAWQADVNGRLGGGGFGRISSISAGLSDASSTKCVSTTHFCNLDRRSAQEIDEMRLGREFLQSRAPLARRGERNSR